MILTHGALGQPSGMSYFATDDEVAAANCTDKRRGYAIDTGLNPDRILQSDRVGGPEGVLFGGFAPYVDDGLGELRLSSRNPLFSVGVDRDYMFGMSAGGNAYHGGYLVPYQDYWMLCLTGGSIHISWADMSKPFQRIVPVKESLTEDGHYARFLVQNYWHQTDPMLSAMSLFGTSWVLVDED